MQETKLRVGRERSAFLKEFELFLKNYNEITEKIFTKKLWKLFGSKSWTSAIFQRNFKIKINFFKILWFSNEVKTSCKSSKKLQKLLFSGYLIYFRVFQFFLFTTFPFHNFSDSNWSVLKFSPKRLKLFTTSSELRCRRHLKKTNKIIKNIASAEGRSWAWIAFGFRPAKSLKLFLFLISELEELLLSRKIFQLKREKLSLNLKKSILRF